MKHFLDVNWCDLTTALDLLNLKTWYNNFYEHPKADEVTWIEDNSNEKGLEDLAPDIAFSNKTFILKNLPGAMESSMESRRCWFKQEMEGLVSWRPNNGQYSHCIETFK